MDSLLEAFATAVGGIIGLFFLVCLGTIMGSLIGWVVGLLFEEAITSTLGALGNLSMWKLGATLGFISGFFRVKVTLNG